VHFGLACAQQVCVEEGKGFKSMSGSVQRGFVIGASVDAGGWLSASWENRIN